MPPQLQERQGIGRREDDGHCQNHEVNTKDLSELKSSFATLRWILGISAPAFMALIVWIGGQNADTLKAIQADVSAVKSVVNNGSISDATVRVELEQLRRDVEELKSRAHR